ncbi:MAG: hypothetical protein V9G24_20340 [Rhodoblastus sp.]
MLAEVGRRRQDLVDAAGRELHATPRVAAFVQPRRDRLEAERATLCAHGHIEDHSDDRRLGVLDHQNLLVLVAALLGDLRGVAEGRRCAVPEALPSVLAHGSVDVLGVLARLVLVEDVEHLADEVAVPILTDVLRD